MKKILFLLLVVSMSIGCIACGEKYEDTNGDDNYTLQTITDENIIKLDIGASGLSYSEESIGALSSSEYHSKNFNGVEQLYLTNFILPSDVCVYVSYINVKGGNFTLAVVNDDEIIHKFDLDTFAEEIYFENIEGSFSIVAAGESANVEFDFIIR